MKLRDGIGDSWEFVTFSSSKNIEEDLHLVANNNSNSFKMINSPKNLNNINRFDKFFKKK